MSSSKPSLREKNDQITEGRFDGYQFDMTVQTDPQLMKDFMRKAAQSVEMITDSVIIKEPVQ